MTGLAAAPYETMGSEAFRSVHASDARVRLARRPRRGPSASLSLRTSLPESSGAVSRPENPIIQPSIDARLRKGFHRRRTRSFKPLSNADGTQTELRRRRSGDRGLDIATRGYMTEANPCERILHVN